MAGLRNNNNTQNAQWADYVGDILRGAQPINQLVPQHPYLNDVPLIDELRHQNTHHVILLTLDVAKKNTQPNNIILLHSFYHYTSFRYKRYTRLVS